MIMNYRDFKFENFLVDSFFIKWVRDPDEESERFWQGFLAKYPEKRNVIKKAAFIIQSLQYEKKYELDEASRSEIINNILEKHRKESDTIRSVYNNPYFHIAASISFLIIVGFTLWFIKFQKANVSLIEKKQMPWITKSTTAGQKLKIVLSDGSKVKLNSNTKISFPNTFNDSSRLVHLIEGEAFFDIKKDEVKAFTVRTGNVETKVLGTSFNVNFNTQEKKLQVALLSGKVRVIKAAQQYLLAPSEMIKFDRENVTKSFFDPLLITGWKDGTLVFDKNPFKQVIEKLENWYGVQIEYNETDNGIYSGVFVSESLENVLDGLGFSTSFRYEIEGKKVKLK
ncbi:MAG: FecR domain-containing protein [Bacteroidota bacterium]